MPTGLRDLRAQVREAKALLGINEDQIADARNSGANRTPEKRDFLDRINKRALAAGEAPVPANY